LTIGDPTPPRIYILMPGRPVVSTITKLMNDTLGNINDKEKYNIRNSFDFKTLVDSITNVVYTSLELVSFDVKSMFTNIPFDLVLDIVNERWQKIKGFTKFA
jgi:hypothetical protein